MKERKRQRRKVKEKREKKGGYAVCPPDLCKHLAPQVYNSLLSQGTKIGRRGVRLCQIAFKLTVQFAIIHIQATSW